MKLTKSEYDILQSVLAHAKDSKELTGITGFFTDRALADLRRAAVKIKDAAENPK